MKARPNMLASAMALLLLMLGAWAGFAADVASTGPSSASGSGSSHGPAFSADSLHLVFVSAANNLVTNDVASLSLNVFVRDLEASNTVLVSVGSNGVSGADWDALSPAISSNGQFIVFVSRAGNLVPGDTNRAVDVFVRDMAAGVTRLVSVDVNGGSPIDPVPSSMLPLSGDPMISEDGRWVFFESRATNLIAVGAPLGGVNIYARDVWSNTTVLVSARTDGLAVPGKCQLLSITPDARRAAFLTTNNTVVPGVTNTSGDAYVRDLPTATTSWASRDAAQVAVNDGTLSADGRFLAYSVGQSSTSARLLRFAIDTGVTTPSPNLFVRDTPQISRDGRFAINDKNLSVWLYDYDGGTNMEMGWKATYPSCPGGTVCGYPPVDYSFVPRMTPDARFICFIMEEYWSDFSTNYGTHMFIRDLWSGTSNRLVRATNGALKDFYYDPRKPVLSADGQRVALAGTATDLANNDLNNASDIFLSDANGSATELITKAHPARMAETASAHSVLGPDSVSADGRFIVTTRADDAFVVGDTNSRADVYVIDTLLGRTMPASVDTNGVQQGGWGYWRPIISADGRSLAVAIRFSQFPQTNLVGITASGETFTPNGMTLIASPSFGAADSPSLSADGSLVAYRQFNSSAGELMNVYLRYRVTPEGYPPSYRFVLMSGLSLHGSAGNGRSIDPVICPDGRAVVFSTRSGNLLDPAAGGMGNALYSTYKVIASLLGTNQQPWEIVIPKRLCSYTHSFEPREWYEPTNPAALHTNLFAVLTPLAGNATNAVVSRDSRYVAFGLTDGSAIWRHDLAASHTNYSMTTNGTNVAVSTNLVAGAANDLVCTNCSMPSLSADGTVVVYLRPRAGSGVVDVFVKDLLSGTESLVSRHSSGAAANASSGPAYTAGDGRLVVFQSRASNLVNDDANGASDIFVHDRFAGTTMLASANAQGRAGNGPSTRPVLSADGSTLVFQSLASDLAAGDYNDRQDIFTVRLSGSDTDNDGMGDAWEVSYFSDLSHDGTADSDGDGANDLAEFRAGTDPTNGGSVFRVLTLQPAGGGARLILWTGFPGWNYRVEYKDNLNAAQWMPVNGTISWNGATASVVDVFAANSPRRIYRAVRLP